MADAVCYFCQLGVHSACSKSYKGECCCARTLKSSEPTIETEGEDVNSVSASTTADSNPVRRTRRKSGRGKRDSHLKDQQSTGRKRAAVQYPLDSDAPCEWQGLKFAGGGDKPIIGCIAGKQQARHHGPDKNTLNNERGNVHRICHRCHNRWHTVNDPGYQWDGHHAPHDPETKATVEDQFKSEEYWSSKKLVKAKD